MSGSTTISSRGKCAGRWPRLALRFCVLAAFSIASVFSSFASSAATAVSMSSRIEVQLIGIEFLRLATEVRAAQLRQKMTEPIALRALGEKQRLQRRNVIRQIFERQCHASRLADLPVPAPAS